MARITETERTRFHKIVDDSIDKLNSSKNEQKIHWSFLSTKQLKGLINVEIAELNYAVDFLGEQTAYWDVLSEDYDVINYALFMADNLRSNL